MTVRVLCLNVWLGGILWDEMIDFLKEESADILLLQEVYNGDSSFDKIQYRCFSELKQMLQYEYAQFAPTFIEDAEGKEIVQGNAILSKYPLEEIGVSFYDVPFEKRDPDDSTKYHLTPRTLQHVVATVGEKKLHLFNTQGIWGTHGKDTDRRLAMADHILEKVSGQIPLVLAGDFNVEDDTKTIGKIKAQLVCVFENQLTSSFNLRRKDIVKNPGFATSVVDMMFVSPDIKLRSSVTPDVDVSDHRPLVCEIEL